MLTRMSSNGHTSRRGDQTQKILARGGRSAGAEPVRSVYWAGVIARARAFLCARVPVGYEDDLGFHFGEEAEATLSHRLGV